MVSVPRPGQESSVPAPVLRTPGKAPGPRARRTQQLILDNARELFMERGYQGTSIEDITSAAGISRASFWTYFATKQDVLRSLGVDAEKAGLALAKEFAALPVGADLEQVTEWVRSYLAFLDAYGAFLQAALQAANDDPELRAWTLASEMVGARVLGKGLARQRGGRNPAGVSPVLEGLAVIAMMERFWYQWRVNGAPFEEETVTRSLAHFLWGAGRTLTE